MDQARGWRSALFTAAGAAGGTGCECSQQAERYNSTPGLPQCLHTLAACGNSISRISGTTGLSGPSLQRLLTLTARASHCRPALGQRSPSPGQQQGGTGTVGQWLGQWPCIRPRPPAPAGRGTPYPPHPYRCFPGAAFCFSLGGARCVQKLTSRKKQQTPLPPGR